MPADQALAAPRRDVVVEKRQGHPEEKGRHVLHRHEFQRADPIPTNTGQDARHPD